MSIDSKQPIIQFKNFGFKYRSQVEPTLFDINLSIYPGEKILIAGPSGCGKSTLAHCINGLIPNSFPGDVSGELVVDGVNPKSEGVFGMSKHVGTVLQDTNGQFIGLTVAEDIAFALENDMVETAQMRSRVDEVAELIDMMDYLKYSPNDLSGGMKQRVSMGGVLVDNVPILLFDEPLANLDPATGKYTIELIDDICQKKDITAIIVEHRLEDVLHKDIDRVIVMRDGRIIADTTPNVLLGGDILKETGIREPLYIAALKHAGAVIDESKGASHVESMELESYKELIRSWYEDARYEAQEVAKAKEQIQKNVVLELQNVDFSYNERAQVLKDVSFKIHEGEMISLVGRNGAGKSTIASLICGFYNPTKGKILLDGKDMAPLSIKERGEEVGLVMQSPNQMISKPMIMEEVGLGLECRGVAKEEIEERVLKSLKICGLYPMRNWPVGALSFGQKKRVSIASILVMEPKILILDEPTAGQDYFHYTEIMEFLKKLNEELGLTIIMITHDMHLMLEYTDRALVLSDGQLIADDTPAKILTNEEIANKAYLKRTSLYDLAKRCEIDGASDFCQAFIEFERKMGQ